MKEIVLTFILSLLVGYIFLVGYSYLSGYYGFYEIRLSELNLSFSEISTNAIVPVYYTLKDYWLFLLVLPVTFFLMYIAAQRVSRKNLRMKKVFEADFFRVGFSIVPIIMLVILLVLLFAIFVALINFSYKYGGNRARKDLRQLPELRISDSAKGEISDFVKNVTGYEYSSSSCKCSMLHVASTADIIFAVVSFEEGDDKWVLRIPTNIGGSPVFSAIYSQVNLNP